jgi:hypothetical protein
MERAQMNDFDDLVSRHGILAASLKGGPSR